MAVQQRRERERADRHRLIVKAARELAEAEGWGAVTTRRLAERVEYSQPVLYSHFKGKSAIVAAVAVEGFAELATALRQARAPHHAPRAALLALTDTYLDFAREQPALYAAMFVHEIDVEFGSEATPEPLKAAFGEFLGAIEPLAAARGDDRETFAEVLWSALHGLATLTEGSRMRPHEHRARVDLLLDMAVSGA
ncbi:TetR/AcrR family transcriptional regulator [Streptomyces sp. ISL-100]|uniref:TetR/AcrR family transcriptional regulator n=1 Tax=Streptomyces sp. ISL-100 TaxID=2819173 RepID=UPI001BEAE93D|nr:TetR/AcrR family transcriptional regulator [Streptomyces sp. ISL-100]MBT2395602.1 TetR/AcrR family transcriptional regulator [Streptomyces sp. ISL-100]